MINRRVRIGYDRQKSIAQFEELVREFSGNNLASALIYNDFATVSEAEKFAAEIDTLSNGVIDAICANPSEISNIYNAKAAEIEALVGDDVEWVFARYESAAQKHWYNCPQCGVGIKVPS